MRRQVGPTATATWPTYVRYPRACQSQSASELSGGLARRLSSAPLRPTVKSMRQPALCAMKSCYCYARPSSFAGVATM